jgi:hypothetical protein
VDYFFGHRGGSACRIVATDGYENEQADADFSDNGSIDFHAGFGDALEDGSHLFPGGRYRVKIVMRGRGVGERFVRGAERATGELC